MFKLHHSEVRPPSPRGDGTAAPAAQPNVLTRLDERPSSAFYWQLTLLATLGGFLFGYDTSNIGSALNFVPYGLHGLARATSSPVRHSERRQEKHPARLDPRRARSASAVPAGRCRARSSRPRSAARPPPSRRWWTGWPTSP